MLTSSYVGRCRCTLFATSCNVTRSCCGIVRNIHRLPAGLLRCESGTRAGSGLSAGQKGRFRTRRSYRSASTPCGYDRVVAAARKNAFHLACASSLIRPLAHGASADSRSDRRSRGQCQDRACGIHEGFRSHPDVAWQFPPRRGWCAAGVSAATHGTSVLPANGRVLRSVEKAHSRSNLKLSCK